jgi:GT2 family glycosyltransferase
MQISLIIPTHNRSGALTRHLEMLARQTLDPALFEIVVVQDGVDTIMLPDIKRRSEKNMQLKVVESEHKGPAAARNLGAKYADGTVLVFCGDDTFPHRSLLYRHWLRHKEADGPIAVQGYTDWWADLPPLDFELFLLESGLQANWSSLKNDNGTWKTDASGFCLTTNYSIAKSEFERLGGFSEEFPHAAWEDVEFGYKGTKFGLKTVFEPQAVNHHAHRQTFDGYVGRNLKEGASRIILSGLHPESAFGLLDPNALRETNSGMFQEAATLARELDHMHAPDLQKLRKERWQRALQLASLEGIRRGIAEKSKKYPVWQAIPHLHLQEQTQHVVTAARNIETGNLAYAETSAEWALQANMDNWALWMVRAEVSKVMGDKVSALRYASQASKLGSGEAWPVEFIKSISEAQ